LPEFPGGMQVTSQSGFPEGTHAWTTAKARLNAPLLLSSHTCFLSMACNGHICEWSPSAACLLDFTQEEICGRRFLDLITIDFHADAQGMIDNALTVGHGTSVPLPMYTRSGRKISVLLHAFSTKQHGKELHIVLQPILCAAGDTVNPDISG